MEPFLTLENIHVAYTGNEALDGISLEIKKGEQWALIGESGSGKTTLLETIAGKHLVRKGRIVHHYYERFIQSNPVSDPYFNYKKLIAEVSAQHHFRNRSNMEEFYYQQRFNSADADEAIAVKEYLEADPQIIKELRLEPLMDKSLIKLSTGETRRLLFAAALSKHPQLLLLDAPFTGLDASVRPGFHELINNLMASGLTIIMAGRESELPCGITHVAWLEKGKLSGTWERKEFEERRKRVPDGQGRPPARFPARSSTSAAFPALDMKLTEQLLAGTEMPDFEYAVRLSDVSIRYGDATILDKVNWEVKRGERWALSGHNGAGKSTLLSLVTADNPQAYANDLVLFDRKRGSGESIWDIKRKIGHVSSELHQYFKTADTCLQVVLSGYFDTLGLIKKCSPAQQEQARSWMKLLGIDEFSGMSFRRCSISVQRLALIGRALIKKPPLLVLDEPCQGMDAGQVQRIRLLTDAVCRISGATLIYVSHYTEEIPSCVDKLLKLDQGRVVYKGDFSPGA